MKGITGLHKPQPLDRHLLKRSYGSGRLLVGDRPRLPVISHADHGICIPSTMTPRLLHDLSKSAFRGDASPKTVAWPVSARADFVADSALLVWASYITSARYHELEDRFAALWS